MSSSSDKYDYLAKVVLVGNSGVGKSSLINRFVDDVFSDTFISTIGVDFKFRTLNVMDKTVKLQIWDTAGQERFRTITASFYRGAHGILVVYDVTNAQSFLDCRAWLEDIRKNTGGGSQDMSITLIGNKSDDVKNRVVSTEEARDFAQQNRMGFFETSAKDSAYVETAFASMVKDIIKQLPPIESHKKGVELQGYKSVNSKKDCAC